MGGEIYYEISLKLGAGTHMRHSLDNKTLTVEIKLVSNLWKNISEENGQTK